MYFYILYIIFFPPFILWLEEITPRKFPKKPKSKDSLGITRVSSSLKKKKINPRLGKNQNFSLKKNQYFHFLVSF